MRVTRRGLLAGAAAGALGATGIYELVDRLATSPQRAAARDLLPEQHLLDLRVVHDDGIAVVVPPLHHQLVTGTVATGDLRSAQHELEHALADLDERFAPTAAGLGVTVAWGLPYFLGHVPAAWAGKDIFLSFEGVDDAYELFVNGHAAGKGGDKTTHQDALQEKKSHNITAWVTPGQKALIAVRVDDWHGAGGIFRPVTLGTLPLNPELNILR